MPPLGYDVDNRLLVINDTEAAVVRRIFEEMLTIGSPTQIAANLTLDGITTKAWTTQDGQTRAGKVKWREVGWNALIAEFAPDSIGAELLEVEA